MQIKKLDFSEFHPLDHNLLQCWDYPGGWRRHLDYSWDFIWRAKILSWTNCRVGRHEWREWYNSDSDDAVDCRCTNCETRKPGWDPSQTTGVGRSRDNPYRRPVGWWRRWRQDDSL